ncbi:hypothetical protein [Fulvimonas yonginensis]|uniref:Type III restriction enzyme C-terminal endonuclease domain-containing protein n=1 Tax=Fulvimonas yonginensis TaxID=1495200 RepID=A0ABU8J7X4_9GAMM
MAHIEKQDAATYKLDAALEALLRVVAEQAVDVVDDLHQANRLGHHLQGRTVKHIYFVAEAKGSMSSLELREIEKTKIRCARKFFDEMNRRFAPENIKYNVVESFGKLMEIVK